MHSFRKRVALVAPALLIALMGTACQNDDEPETTATTAATTAAQERTGGSYSAYLGEPEHLFPTNTQESEGNLVLSGLFTGLVSYDAKTSQPVNEMAESMTSTDQQKWTVKIKPDWTFHNGEKVTAQSYVDSWNYGAYGPNAQQNSYFFENIAGYADVQGEAADPKATPPKAAVPPKAKTMSGLKVVDDTTFEVTLNAPFSQFPTTLGYNAFYPMPKVALEGGEAGLKKFETAPIGNGPFMMDGTWVHNTSIKLKAYPDYKGAGKAQADSVEFKIYKEDTTAYTDTQAGNLDIMDLVPPAKIPSMKKDFPDHFIEYPSSTFTYIGFPLYNEKFGGDAKKDLRHALSMAIDRDTITKTIFGGTRTPAKSVVAPVVAGSRPDACKYCDFKPDEAKALFDKAGGWTGPMTMYFNSGAGHEQWVEAVANMWREHLGITDIKFKSLDFAQYNPLVDDKKLDGPYRLGWGMDYPSPQNYLQPLYSTTGSSNNFGYSNKAFDDLIAKGNQAPTVEEGITFYQQAEDIQLEDMPNIPLWFANGQGVFSDRVENVIVDAFGNIRLADVRVKK